MNPPYLISYQKYFLYNNYNTDSGGYLQICGKDKGGPQTKYGVSTCQIPFVEGSEARTGYWTVEKIHTNKPEIIKSGDEVVICIYYDDMPYNLFAYDFTNPLKCNVSTCVPGSTYYPKQFFWTITLLNGNIGDPIMLGDEFYLTNLYFKSYLSIIPNTISSCQPGGHGQFNVNSIVKPDPYGGSLWVAVRSFYTNSNQGIDLQELIHTAYWADQIYEPIEEVKKELARKGFTEITIATSGFHNFFSSAVKGFVAYLPNSKVLYLCFQGCPNVQHVLFCLKGLLYSTTDELGRSEVFLSYWNDLRPVLFDAIDKLAKSSGFIESLKEIIVCGHSLGGVLSSYCAYELSLRMKKKFDWTSTENNFKMFSFASPCPGIPSWQSLFRNCSETMMAIRVYNPMDPIVWTLQQIPQNTYSHVGEQFPLMSWGSTTDVVYAHAMRMYENKIMNLPN